MRSVKEWEAKHDDQSIPSSVRRRVYERQNGVCALSGRPFMPGDRIEYDHKKPLWLGGEHRESNLQAVLSEPHKDKTRAEADVRKKVWRVRDKHLGLKKKEPWNKHYKRKLNGELVRREET